MVAIVEPARWEAVRAVCERWDLPVAIIGRVTAGARHRRAHRARRRRARSTPTGGRSPAPGSSPGSPPRALASGAIVFERESRAADPPPRRPGPGRRRRARRLAPAARPGPGRGAPGAARARRTSRRAARCTSSTTRNVQANTVAGPGRGAAVLRIKGTTKALVATTDGNAPVGLLDPWLGAAMSVAEAARNVVDHRRPAAGRHELPQLRRPDPARGVLAAQRGRPRPVRRLHRPRAAGHRRQRVAVQRGAGLRDRADARDRRRRAARRRREARRPRLPRGRATPSLLVGEPAPGSPAASTRGSPGVAARGRAARRSTWPARARLQAFIREAVERGLVESCQDVSGGGLAVARRRDGDLGRSRRAAPAHRGRLAGRRPVRREPVAAGRRGRAAPRPGVHPARPPARAARSTSSGSPAARGSSSSSPARARPAPPRSGAAGSPTRSTWPIDDLRHAWDHGLPRALGWEGSASHGSRRRSALMCGVVGVVLPDRGHEAAAVAATALFALQHRGQESAGVGVSDGAQPDDLQGPRHGQPGPRRAADPVAARATSRSPTAATRRPARRSGRTPSRRSASARAGRSRSATTATSSTPASCSASSRAAAAGCRRAPTPSC